MAIVFQRTPSSVDLRGNAPTDEDWARTLQPGWPRARRHNFADIVEGRPFQEDLVADGWTDIFRSLASGGALSKAIGALEGTVTAPDSSSEALTLEATVGDGQGSLGGEGERCREARLCLGKRSAVEGEDAEQEPDAAVAPEEATPAYRPALGLTGRSDGRRGLQKPLTAAAHDPGSVPGGAT